MNWLSTVVTLVSTSPCARLSSHHRSHTVLTSVRSSLRSAHHTFFNFNECVYAKVTLCSLYSMNAIAVTQDCLYSLQFTVWKQQKETDTTHTSHETQLNWSNSRNSSKILSYDKKYQRPPTFLSHWNSGSNGGKNKCYHYPYRYPEKIIKSLKS